MKEFLKDSKFTLILLTVLTAIFFFFNKKKEKKEKEKKKTVDSDSMIYPWNRPSATFPLRPYSQVGEYSPEMGSRGTQIGMLIDICNGKYGTSLSRNWNYTPEVEKAFLENFGMIVFNESDFEEIRSSNWRFILLG